MLSPLLWFIQGECLTGRNQARRLFPMTSLMFCNVPQSHGLNPAGVSRMAKVRVGKLACEWFAVVDACVGMLPLCCKRNCCSSAGLGYLMVRKAAMPRLSTYLAVSSGLGI